MECPSETRLQAFVDGELLPADLEPLSEHLDTCDACRAVVGGAQPVALDDEREVDRIGRYVLRRVIGRGGMGVVYEAVDPELQRVVALKLLHRDLGDEQRRLLVEAQAMALLSHPNVVTIHDVGREQERVFIVMALVSGTTLRHWLAREPRTVTAILDVFEQAALGLRAAHDAGLVHRDFKPENVFVGRDERVLVGDFGLAVRGDVSTDASGSLAYMAPEQRAGEKVDARSDQYAFCVALGEALATAPGGRPRWLARIVARGTQTSPAARYPSLSALLAALRAGRGGARRRRLVALATVAVVALGSGGGLWLRARATLDPLPCRARDADMAAVWSDEVRQRAHAAFLRTQNPLAAAAWTRTSDALGTYTRDWRAAQVHLCEGPRPETAEARAAAAQRTSCLGERLELARAVAASLEHVDAPMLEQLPAMLQLLPRVSACDDARELAQQAPPPPADQQPAVLAARKKIASAATTVAAGRYAEGLALADASYALANATAYLPVLAEAYLWVGTAHGRLGHTKESEQALEQAASSASAGHAPALAVAAWVQLMHFIGLEGKRYDDGARYSQYASAALEGLPGSFELEAERLSWSRAMLLDRKRYDEALAVSRQELALVELRFGATHRRSAAALDGLAGALAGLCRSRDAREPQQRACTILAQDLGTPHPQLALCLVNLAALEANVGEQPRALATKRQAIAMFEQVPGHPNHVAMAHRNIVRSLLELGQLDDARAELEAAAALSHRDSDETSVILLRGELHRRAAQLPEALADHRLALTRTQAAEPVRRLDPLVALAETELVAAEPAAALDHAAQAVTLAASVYGESSCRLAEPLREQAEALVALGRASEALPPAERALRLARAAQVDPRVVTRAEATVARAAGAARMP